MSIPAPFRPPRQKDLNKVLEETEKPVVIYFIEPQTNLCQLIEPAISEIAQNHVNIFNFIGARVANFRDYFYQWRIRSSPAFLIFKNSEEIRRLAEFKYSDTFKEDFKKFLIGDFLFNYAGFEVVDSVSMPHLINTGTYYHLTAFMQPGDPTNWRLSPVLEKIKENHTSQIRLSLVNTRKSPDLVKKHNVPSFPSMILFKEGAKIRTWTEIPDLQQFVEECEEELSGG